MKELQKLEENGKNEGRRSVDRLPRNEYLPTYVNKDFLIHRK
jgi:hypothetical protein